MATVIQKLKVQITACMHEHMHIFLLYFLSSFTSLGTGRCTQEAEPVQGAYL